MSDAPSVQENDAAQRLLKILVQFRRMRFNSKEVSPKRPDHLQLKHSEVMLLFALADTAEQNPGGLRVSELSALLRVKPPTVTPLLRNLEQKGMIARAADVNDRRSAYILLTQKGFQFAGACNAHMKEKIVQIVTALGVEKSSQFADLFEDVLAALRHQEKEQNTP